MEHRVHQRRNRKFQFVCHLSHAGQDTEWSKEFEGQLLIAARSQGRLHIWLDFDEYQVTNLKLSFGPMLISLLLHTLLSAIQMLADHLRHQSPVR